MEATVRWIGSIWTETVLLCFAGLVAQSPLDFVIWLVCFGRLFWRLEKEEARSESEDFDDGLSGGSCGRCADDWSNE